MTIDLQDADQVDQAVGGSKALLRMQEPWGKNAILGQAVHDAVGSNQTGVDGAGKNQKSDDDHERLKHEFGPIGARTVSWPGRR